MLHNSVCCLPRATVLRHRPGKGSAAHVRCGMRLFGLSGVHRDCAPHFLWLGLVAHVFRDRGCLSGGDRNCSRLRPKRGSAAHVLHDSFLLGLLGDDRNCARLRPVGGSVAHVFLD